MRINKYIAQHTTMSRRKADSAIESGRVLLNGEKAQLGDVVKKNDSVTIDGAIVTEKQEDTITLLLNKPAGYVCSHDGQGSPIVYDLLPKEYKSLNIAGRLDKDSSGLVVLTSDGDLLQELTHPSNDKEKVYEVTIDKELSKDDLRQLITGVDIGDARQSKFVSIEPLGYKKYKIILKEGRNRQIRRSIQAINKSVIKLKRTAIGEYTIDDVGKHNYSII